MKTIKLTLACALFSLLSQSVNAQESQQTSAEHQRDDDTPFQLEDFLPAKSKFNLTWRTSYLSSNEDGDSLIVQPISIGSGQSIQIPLQLTDNSSSDTLSSGLDLSYGWTDKTTIFTGFNAFVSDSIRVSLGQRDTHTTEGIANVYLGMNYKLSSITASFYNTLFVSSLLAHKSGGDYVHGKTVTLGWNGFYTYDPLILSTATVYSYHWEREVDNNRVKPGALFSLSNAVSFVVNPVMSLDWMLTIHHRRDTRVNNVQQYNVKRTLTTMGMGLTWTLSEAMRLQITSSFGVGGNDTSELSIAMLYKPG